MDEKVRSIQARLRAALSQPLELGDRFADVPLIAFEEVAGVPDGAETIVVDVIVELKRRGYRVANLKRFGLNSPSEVETGQANAYRKAGSEATVLASPGQIVLVRQTEAQPSLEDMLNLLGNGYDVIVGESFGYISIPKILITRKVQEGFSLGLPNIIGYVADRDGGAMIPRFAPDDAKGIADMIVARIIEPHKGAKPQASDDGVQAVCAAQISTGGENADVPAARADMNGENADTLAERAEAV